MTNDEAGQDSGIVALLQSHDACILKLEDEGKKTLFKRLTTSANTGALLLGLILTVAALYDTFVRKPEADRISRLSQFNEAVNAAAKTRQAVIQTQLPGTDPKVQLAVQSMATPQILNDISTARAMLRDLSDADVGIPQLSILISESLTAGDLTAATEFVSRAVRKSDTTPYLRAEAKRYEGRLHFLTADPVHGRQSYQEALSILGNTQGVAAQRAYDLGDLTLLELPGGNCESAITDLNAFIASVHAPGVPQQARQQLLATAKSQIGQMQGLTCTLPTDLNTQLSE